MTRISAPRRTKVTSLGRWIDLPALIPTGLPPMEAWRPDGVLATVSAQPRQPRPDAHRDVTIPAAAGAVS